ncbi:MAG: UDP-2,3-diacylglucosamine diphosphatase [Planctomycetota bacterium]|jgi:UDP-2,3-diacylglucosamine hydrolase
MKHVEAIIFSDVHASESDPQGVAMLLGFLEKVCPRAARVFILGDFFNFWFGPGQVRHRPYSQILEALGNLASSGTAVTFYHGNRDFYLDEDIARRYGFTLVRDRSIEMICGRRVLLCHGDMLCVNDASYYVMRTFLRHPVTERVMRRTPALLTRAMARLYRAHSKRVVASKSREAFARDAKAVLEHFALGADVIVCGHTHEEGVESYATDEGAKPLYSLGDFGATGSFLECGDKDWHFRRAAEAID